MKRVYKCILLIAMSVLVLGVLSGCTDNHDKSIELTNGNTFVDNTTDLDIQFPDREYSKKDSTFLRSIIFPKLKDSHIDNEFFHRIELYTVELNEQEDGTIKGDVKGLGYIGNKKYNITLGISTSTVRSTSFTMVLR